jgi:hypothetical protein
MKDPTLWYPFLVPVLIWIIEMVLAHAPIVRGRILRDPGTGAIEITGRASWYLVAVVVAVVSMVVYLGLRLSGQFFLALPILPLALGATYAFQESRYRKVVRYIADHANHADARPERG